MGDPQATDLALQHRFDAENCRHRVNDRVVVMHCHHYATLYCQLANDCGMLDGKALLAECAEDTFHDVLKLYCAQNGIDAPAARLQVTERYHAATGMGQLQVVCAGPDAGLAHLRHSHIDEGWKHKWGAAPGPVNFIGQGFIAAGFAVAYDLPPRSFRAVESASIATGAEVSVFQVVRR